MLLRTKSSLELPPDGKSCTKLVCTPAPTLTGGGGAGGGDASCARSGVEARSTAQPTSAGAQRRAMFAASSRTNVFSTVHPFPVARDARIESEASGLQTM